MFQTFFANWDFPPVVCSELVLVAVIYTVGFLRIQKTRPQRFPSWRWGSFMGGLLALLIAVASPLDTLDDQLLTIHMVQHFVLMSIAPPLIVFGSPVVPLIRGLPRWIARSILGPLIRRRWLRAFFHGIVRPKPAWLLMNVSFIVWHIPAAYDATLASEFVHNCEHACFFFFNVLFWWPLLEPWPSRFRGNRWLLIPYLVSADLVNTIVAAFLVFAGRVVYPSYAAQPRTFGISALADQSAAGAFMWVLGSIVFLIPACAIALQLLSARPAPRRRAYAAR